MRELKFRAWDENEKRMINPEYSDWEDFMIEPDGSIFRTYETGTYDSYREKVRVDYKLMQFTGLKDKNGTDIYEGDILDYTVFDFNDNDTQFKGEVKWFGSGFIATQIPDSRCNGDYGIELDWVVNQDEEIEVIGNIHQNKELLNQ